jgi:2-dehydro-3-deoxyphosphogluconate aldolase/(4S)-4-hydroxy-2-oxoglutarate aldolase
MSFETIFTSPIMAILRGFSPDETTRLAWIAWDAGIEAVEVPIGRPEHVAALRAAVGAGKAVGKQVGAGTVISVDQVHAAVRAGATYTVAPGFDPGVLQASTAAGLPHLPGVATATELQRAAAAGCSWVKAFPAMSLGPSWFRDIRGPFPDVKFVATGGITAQTAEEFLDAGASVAAVGSALSDPAQLPALAKIVIDRFRFPGR